MRRARSHGDGFTLIELLIVLGIVSLLAVLAVPALGSLSGADARKAAGELAGSMRALFDTAGLRHSTCRLALDLEHRGWWAECAPGAAGIAKDQDRAQDEKTLEERFPDEKDAELRRLLAKTAFGKFQDRMVGKRELPGKVAFGAVHLEGRRDAIDSGIAYVYFFAGGQALRAWVPVVDGKSVYTVVLEPMTGRTRVVPGAVEVRE